MYLPSSLLLRVGGIDPHRAKSWRPALRAHFPGKETTGPNDATPAETDGLEKGGGSE